MKKHFNVGKNNPNYIDGRKNKKYYCKDCGIRISFSGGFYRGGRCRSCAYKLRRLSEEHKEKLRKFHLGKKLSEETKRKISTSESGNKHYNWQGGKSFEEYPQEFDSALKEQIRFRDGYKCKLCGCPQIENGRCLDVHHIDYNKKNNNINNLIALCHRCNAKVNFNKDYWTIFLKGKLKCYVSLP
jgi:hypothetical protein